MCLSLCVSLSPCVSLSLCLSLCVSLSHREGALGALCAALWEPPSAEAGWDPPSDPWAPVAMGPHHRLHGVAAHPHGPLGQVQERRRERGMREGKRERESERGDGRRDGCRKGTHEFKGGGVGRKREERKELFVN